MRVLKPFTMPVFLELMKFKKNTLFWSPNEVQLSHISDTIKYNQI